MEDNKSSKRKSTQRAKLKPANQEQIHVEKTFQESAWKIPQSYR